MKARIFLITFSIAFCNTKILGFLFSTKNSLTWGVKCEIYTSQNGRKFIRVASKILLE